MVVGLAPGAHGSNRTGRQFTGDASGNFLYPALYRAGFASQPESTGLDDGMTLTDMYIAAVCRCVPPDNKPLPQEIANCQPYLEHELELIQPKVIVVLGRIAFEQVVRIDRGLLTVDGRRSTVHRPPSTVFAHGAVYPLSTGQQLVCSYHPSQQNTLTGKLTVAMFDSVWQKVKEQLVSVK
jgi:uracil-DNA glycosylase family 4